DVASRVQFGERLDVGSRRFEIRILGRDDVEQRSAGDPEALCDDVARAAGGEIGFLDRGELLLQRLYVGPGDGRVARRFLADPVGPGLRRPRPRVDLSDPGVDPAEQALAEADPRADVVIL